MLRTITSAVGRNFLGSAPRWYKLTIIGFLVVNPFILLLAGPFVSGWVIVLEFIFCLAMALQCYPLQPGGLLAIEAVILGMTSPDSVYEETQANFAVILLLMFMVAGIYFMRDILLLVFTKLLINVRSKLLLSLTFTGVGGRALRVPGCIDGRGRRDRGGDGLLHGLPPLCLGPSSRGRPRPPR